jgi:DDE superfamily endonuclease
MAKGDTSGGIRAMELWLLPFAAMFTRPSWLNVVALTSGALLCLNRRPVCAALPAMDGAADKGFSRFHRFLSRAEWSGLQGSQILLGLLQKAFIPNGEPLVIAVDDAVERRRGARIRDKGIWRDAVRSSRSFFAKAEGLRWLSLQVVVRPGFAKRTWGLPFLTILSRSEQVDAKRQRRHQTLPEKATWAMRLVARWCPGRCLVMVADGAYASLDLFWTLRERVLCVARGRMDARFFNPPPPRKQGQKGRPCVLGTRQLAPRTRAVRKATKWERMTIPGWRTKDGRTERAVDVATSTALWSAHGKTMPVRWVLTRDPAGRAETRVFVCSDPKQSALQILT